MSTASSYGCGPGGVNMYAPDRRMESPYLDFATKAVPKTFSDVIDWSEHVTSLSDDLGDGLRKLYTYFCTPVDVDAFDLENQEYDANNAIKFRIMLEQLIDYPTEVSTLGRNTGVYGNDFVTITLKHKRLIVCPDCSWSVLLSHVRRMPEVDFKFKDMVFSGNCQGRCKNTGRKKFQLQHAYDRRAENLIFKHWNIRELEFDYMEAINELRVYWKIPNRLKKRVLDDQDPETIHDLDISVLKSICEGKLLEFDDRVMFHAKEPHLAGLENRGLGIPRTLSLARQHWLIQLLKKQCQALASSYVTPLQFFSMGQTGSTGLSSMDALQTVDARVFADNVEEMLQAHKLDPRRKFVLPFPVQFQYAGGGADQFVPAGLLQLASQDLSNSLVPMAMLRGELTAQAAPMFLRTFEAFNREIPAMYNKFLWFVVSRVTELLKISPVGCIHQTASIADNMNMDAMLMQTAGMGQTSNYAWMHRVGLNPRTENNRKLAEARQELEFQESLKGIQQEFGFQDAVSQNAQMPMQQAAMGPPQEGAPGAPGAPAPEGAAPPPGAPGGGQMGTPLLPSQGFIPSSDAVSMEGEAVQLAQMLGEMPQAQRNQELSIIRNDHQAFHHMVTGELEKLRQSTAMQARQEMAPNL